MYTIILSKQAQKDIVLLKAAKLDQKARELLNLIRLAPFQTPPPYEALSGRLFGLFSRRISFHHRLVYQVLEEQKIVHVLRMWSHYDRLR